MLLPTEKPPPDFARAEADAKIKTSDHQSTTLHRITCTLPNPQQILRASSRLKTYCGRLLPRPLDCIFAPKAVALIGATESTGSVGRTLLENLQKGGFPGEIYPVNPKRATRLLGVRGFTPASPLPCRSKVDLAVIVTPPRDGA